MLTFHESVALLLEGTLLALVTQITLSKKMKNSLLFRILAAVFSSIIIILIFKLVYNESYSLILICNAIYIVMILVLNFVIKPDYDQKDAKHNYILPILVVIVLLGNIGAKCLSGKNHILSDNVDVIVITDLRTNQEYTINDTQTIDELFDSVSEYNLNVHDTRQIDDQPTIQITTYRYNDIYCNTIELYSRDNDICEKYRNSDEIKYYKVPTEFVESIYDYIDNQKK